MLHLSTLNESQESILYEQASCLICSFGVNSFFKKQFIFRNIFLPLVYMSYELLNVLFQTNISQGIIGSLSVHCSLLLMFL